jgi:hypothetical protein
LIIWVDLLDAFAGAVAAFCRRGNRLFGGVPYRGVAPFIRRAYLTWDIVRQRIPMTSFEDRQRAFETKFARDQEMQFKIVARRNRLLGQWAARKMSLTEAEADAYARDVIRADFEEAGDEDVIRKLLGDLTSAGVEIDEAEIRAQIEHKTVEARRHFIETME